MCFNIYFFFFHDSSPCVGKNLYHIFIIFKEKYSYRFKNFSFSVSFQFYVILMNIWRYNKILWRIIRWWNKREMKIRLNLRRKIKQRSFFFLKLSYNPIKNNILRKEAAVCLKCFYRQTFFLSFQLLKLLHHKFVLSSFLITDTRLFISLLAY